MPSLSLAPSDRDIVDPTTTTFQVSAVREPDLVQRQRLPSAVELRPMVPGGRQPYLAYFVANASPDGIAYP